MSVILRSRLRSNLPGGPQPQVPSVTTSAPGPTPSLQESSSPVTTSPSHLGHTGTIEFLMGLLVQGKAAPEPPGSPETSTCRSRFSSENSIYNDHTSCSFSDSSIDTDNYSISEGPISDDDSPLIANPTMVTQCFRQVPISMLPSPTSTSPPGFFKRTWTTVSSWVMSFFK